MMLNPKQALRPQLQAMTTIFQATPRTQAVVIFVLCNRGWGTPN